MVESIISLKKVCYKYPSGVLAVDGLNVELPKGQRIALLGGNGAGKSTMLLMLVGILRPDNGSVAFQSSPYQYKRKALREIRKKVGFLFQDSDNQLLAPTVYEEISFGLTNLYIGEHRKMNSSIRNRVHEKVQTIMDDFHLADLANRPPHELSAGQKKRVCLASILAMKPEVLLCDEPTSNLDAKHAQLTMEYINKLNNEGKTVLIATHDVDLAYEWADQIIILKDGKALCNGKPQDVFGNAELIENADLKQPYLVRVADAICPGKFPRSLEELVRDVS
jgi:cobalt/nickel transport system ATP-binding protein